MFNATTKISLLLLLSLVPVPVQSGQFPQMGSLALKSQRAKQLMAEGKFEQAISLYRELNQAVPNNAGLILNLGMALQQAGKKREAVPVLETAVKLDPGVAPAWLFLGTARLQLGETALAVKAFKRVLDLQPDQREARQMLAGALLALDHLEQAAEQYQKLSGLDLESPEAWFGLGRSFEALSGRAFDRLQTVAPQSSYSLALMGETRLREQQLSSAFYLYRQALEEKPTLRGLHKALAEIYREAGHLDWAETEEKRELQLSTPDCRDLTLECQYEAGRYDELIAAAKQARTAESFYWASRAYNQLALNAFSRLGQLPPSAELHELKARIYNSQKKYPEATSEWREALKASPVNAEIQKQLAISLKLGQDYSEALPLFQELLRQQPASAEINYLTGDTLLDLQRAEEAIPLLKRALSRDPKFLAAHKSLARADLAAGKAMEAIPHLKAALPTDEDGSLHFQLAQAYRAIGQSELAKKTLEDYQAILNSTTAAREIAKRQTEISAP